MDFSLTQAQTVRKQAAIAFANEQLQQDLDTLDHEQTFNLAGWRACAEHGYMGLPVPTAYGGRGVALLETVLSISLKWVPPPSLFTINMKMPWL